jgi:hypothetical protein
MHPNPVHVTYKLNSGRVEGKRFRIHCETNPSATTCVSQANVSQPFSVSSKQHARVAQADMRSLSLVL